MAIKHKISPEKLEKAAYILKTIAHPLRLSIIEHLTIKEELSVTQICELLNAEQSLISHHLQNLKLKGLLVSRKAGVSIIYSLKEKGLIEIIRCVEKCNCNM
ncbi:ArsR/SmtB family transcription factor [Cytophaga aurantiaca]|uniref:ArsR/SmtB family transcription factor n=1 Tax=Cytophaga aurantiaca TaxID=29530 RepID=UPI000373F009|nr:metalloregulator ArsR/SmtB family transcription factor [Cytophaga aurantiaca]